MEYKTESVEYSKSNDLKMQTMIEHLFHSVGYGRKELKNIIQKIYEWRGQKRAGHEVV